MMARLAHGQARDGMRGRIRGNGLQLVEDALQAVRGVLAIDQQPVEARAGGDLAHGGVGQVEPVADLRALFKQRLLEGVGWGLHGWALVDQEDKQPDAEDAMVTQRTQKNSEIQ